MSFQSPLPQECYFYQGRWNEETVNVFIRVLLDDVKQGVWVVDAENQMEIQSALDFINVMMEREFSWNDALRLMKLLKLRYSTFKYVLDSRSVRWDRHYNHVHVDSDVWEELFKWNEFTKAFYHKGDAIFGSFKKLFETLVVLGNETINISSDGTLLGVPNSAAAPFVIGDSEGEQEVSSPEVTIRMGIKKKLFKEGLTASARELISAESNSSKHSKILSAAKDKGVIVAVKTTIKKESSSCASSSPLKLTYSPLGI